VAERDSLAERERALIAQHAEVAATLAEHQRLLREHRDRSLAEKTSLNHEVRGLQHEHHRLRRDFDGMSAYLQRIENSILFRVTRPLSDAKGWVDRNLLGRTPGGAPANTVALSAGVAAADNATPITPTAQPIDVIVPVYRGLADTQRCVRSVLAARNATPFRLIVINDASPEPLLADWLREFAATDARVVLIENDSNLGFVATVNRGMALSDANDVLLLNSDTEVANDWLDRMRRAAYCDRRVGTVTPFSNNATIFSYPKTCSGNALPYGHSTQSLDALFARTLAGEVIDVPTGVGFCMYVRRDCLAQVGLFDVAQFGKGYGEENDFCQRAQKAGWRNLHALDTFVTHSGGVSFGESKNARELAAMETLRRLHPGYERQVHEFVAADAAERFRQRVDLARISAGALPVVLMVMHDREGGTLRHLHELAAWAADRATCLVLTPARGPSVRLQLLSASGNTVADANEGFALTFQLPSEFPALVDCLRALRVGHLHYHHLLGHAAEVMSLPAHLGVAYDFTAHDYYAVCPQISLTGRDNTYCGEEGPAQCGTCLLQSPAPGGVAIAQWRETHGGFVAAARHVLAPSHDAAQRLLRYIPAADVRYAPHDGLVHALPSPLPARLTSPLPAPRALAAGAPLKVVVIGALGPIKGADVLEAVAALAAAQSAPIDLHLIGYAYRSLRTQPRANLTVHGKYDEADLGRLLDWLRPDVVWFPAQWPETYSYTLNACLERGLAVVAPDLGAFSERLSGRAWTWVQSWNSTPADWLRFFVDLRDQHFATGRGPMVTHRMQPISEDIRVKPWSYERDYLAGVAVPDRAATLSDEFLLAHRPQRTAGAAALRHGVKRTLLVTALRLRASPALSRVTKAVPLRWQTRFKSWLQT
jgi:O-antigen biosynthesis protein